MGGWLGGKREAWLVGLGSVVGWASGVPRRGQAFDKKVGWWLGGAPFVHPWPPVPHTSPVPRSAPDGDVGDVCLCYAACSAAMSKATQEVPNKIKDAAFSSRSESLAAMVLLYVGMCGIGMMRHHPGTTGWVPRMGGFHIL